MITINEETKTQASCRWIINNMSDFSKETGFVPVFDASDKNKEKNLKFALIPPGKTFEDRQFVGDWPNRKIKDHMLEMIHNARVHKAHNAKPLTITLSRDPSR